MKTFSEQTIKNWARFLPVIAVVLTAIIFSISFIYQTKKNHDKEHKQINTLILNQAKTLAKDRVTNVIEILTGIKDKHKDKSLKIQKKEIQNFIQNFRFKNNNYVFILDTSGTIISHIKQSLIGKNLWDKQNNGDLYVQNIIQTGLKKDGGFITYEATVNPTTQLPAQKISYITKLDDFDWIIGAGIYLADMDSVFKENNLLLEKDLNESIINNIILTIIMTLICVFFIYLPSNNISKVMQRYKRLLVKKNKALKKKIQERTKEQDSLLSLFNHVDSVLFKWKYESNTLTYVSKSIVNITGYMEKDFLNKTINIKDCIHKDDLVEYRRQYHEALKSDKHYYESKPYRIITKDSQVKWIHDYKLFVRNDQGFITNFIGYIRDITLLKEYDLTVANQSKMASLGEMIGNISHQWRQPLSAITTAASGLKMQKECELLDDEVFEQAIEGIMKNSMYLSETINYFTNYIKQNQEVELFDVHDVLDTNLQLVDANIKMNQINITCNFCNDVKISGNTHDLLQVSMNIINNAIDILKNKEYKRLIFVTTNVRNKCLQITIQDNAGGIKKDNLNKIFEPYFTTKHKSLGTGLGLYISHSIISKMGGQLLAKNKKYVYDEIDYCGAEFIIKIPIKST